MDIHIFIVSASENVDRSPSIHAVDRCLDRIERIDSNHRVLITTLIGIRVEDEGTVHASESGVHIGYRNRRHEGEDHIVPVTTIVIDAEVLTVDQHRIPVVETGKGARESTAHIDDLERISQRGADDVAARGIQCGTTQIHIAGCNVLIMSARHPAPGESVDFHIQ
ncbi:hypothetical protein V6x_13160 [Gimesia chilikensis]|uniref:Uncharacterized protein n=1 Tax=Gimesia chilikensis TaxID=2605989 RepID=A0A517W8S5_9PLAN|nr:hypothetical protein V6x_13160 [Gimesia chilikensis]